MKGERNAAICAWCGNQLHDVCPERCQPEGLYRYLEPEPLAAWELPPELPPFRDLVSLTAAERLALIYLAVVYALREADKGR